MPLSIGGASGGSGGSGGSRLVGPLPARDADLLRVNFDNWPHTMWPTAVTKPGYAGLGLWRNEVSPGDGHTFAQRQNCNASPVPSGQYCYGRGLHNRRGLVAGGSYGVGRGNQGMTAMSPPGLPPDWNTVTRTWRLLVNLPLHGTGTQGILPGNSPFNSHVLLHVGGMNGDASAGAGAAITTFLIMETYVTWGTHLRYTTQRWNGSALETRSVIYTGLLLSGTCVIHVTCFDNGDGTHRPYVYVNGLEVQNGEPNSITNPLAVLNHNPVTDGVGSTSSNIYGGVSVGQLSSATFYGNDTQEFVVHDLAFSPEFMSAEAVAADYAACLV